MAPGDRARLVHRMERLSWALYALASLVLATSLMSSVPVPARVSSVVAGVLILVIAGYDEWAERHRHAERAADPTWLLMLLGMWLVVYPFFLEASNVYLWTNVVAGILLLACSLAVVVLATRLRVSLQATRRPARPPG